MGTSGREQLRSGSGKAGEIHSSPETTAPLSRFYVYVVCMYIYEKSKSEELLAPTRLVCGNGRESACVGIAII